MASSLQFLSATALPIIDTDYDYETIKRQVDDLVADEMKKFSITTSDIQKIFPHLWSDEQVENNILRIESIKSNVTSSSMIDPEKFSIRGAEPDPSLQADAQAWRKSVAHAKSQYIYQESQLLTLELLEKYLSGQYLAYNNGLEILAKTYAEQTQILKRQVHEVQKSRSSLQNAKTYPLLNKYLQRKNMAIVNKIHCDIAYESLRSSLLGRGFDFDAYLESQKEVIDPNDGRINSTVREYEAVHVEDAEDSDEDSKNSAAIAKKARHH